MNPTSILLILLLSLSFVYAGCKSGEQPSDTQEEPTTMEKVEEAIEEPVEEAVEKTQEMHEEAEADMEKSAPPKVAAELWDLINKEGYREHWKMMPGQDAYQDAGDGKLVTTYVNGIYYRALERGEDKLPPGGIVVSDNYDMDKTLQSVSVKANIPGYDKTKGDIFTVTYDPGGKPIGY